MLLFSSPCPLPSHCTRVQQRVWSLSSLASSSSSDATCASYVPLRVCRCWARSSTAWRLPCRQESASFSSTSFPCVSKERLQSTISQAETERDANTKVELGRRNETMNDVYRAPSPLGVPSFACLCRFLCSCFLRRSPWPAFADPSLFGALQLRSTTPELIPSNFQVRPKTSVFHVALHADVRTLTKHHEAQGKTSTRRETQPSLAEGNSKTSNTTLWCSWYR